MCVSITTSLPTLLKDEGKHLMFDTHYDSDIYTKDFIKAGRHILKKAKESVKDDETLLFRVEELYAQILYLSVKCDPWKSVKDGSADRIKSFSQGYRYECKRKRNSRAIY